MSSHESCERFEILLDSGIGGSARFHLDHSEVVPGARLMHEQVGLGLASVAEIRMGAFIDFAVEAVRKISRPELRGDLA